MRADRSRQTEIMDDFDLQGPELKKTLDDLDRVNKWLGGNKITLDGIDRIFSSACFAQPVNILDVGCGNGSILKEVAQMGRRKGIAMQLKGIDANPHAVEIAKENCTEFPEITFETQNIFTETFANQRPDIILCTLTLHHFEDNEIKVLMQRFSDMCIMGIVVNDLQRSRLAYLLFQLFCAVFIRNEIAREDGLTSIQKAFRRGELKEFGRGLQVRKQKISWKWAFRYQWILWK
ncbi:methyltransferase domain-containing protein [Salinimicrobium soli]|uniref:methyltransferase domain-containing protein n=1 Tax=Salinimicrobium soli TaxID=1254399 RepID=UPI003AACA235